MTIFFNPEDEISVGVHETIGPCNETQDVNTVLGMVMLISQDTHDRS
jgi:hypothetical protein